MTLNWLNNLVEHYRKKDEIASIFGVILYTDVHANIKKVLMDNFYWTAFDKISGPHWIIFSIRPHQGKMVDPSPPPDTMARMVPIWEEPSKNGELLEGFELESTKNLPILLVFTESLKDMDGVQNITNTFTWTRRVKGAVMADNEFGGVIEMHELMKAVDNFEKDPTIVKVFGAIIYSNSHPHIKKVLKDEDYWLALDDISGTRWAIFAARAIEGRTEIRGGGPPGTFGMMYQVWIEPSENRKLIEYLEIESTKKPLFVIFTRLKKGSILKSILTLDDTSTEKAYGRLNKIIRDLTSSIERIEKENIEDYESVFNALNMSVTNIRDLDVLKRLFNIYQLLKKIKP